MTIDKQWMSKKELEKEQTNLNILNNSSLKLSEKASLLGFKKSRVYVDDIAKTGWVNGEELYLKLKDLVESRTKYPLGFDFYYWGNEYFKMNSNKKY